MIDVGLDTFNGFDHVVEEALVREHIRSVTDAGTQDSAGRRASLEHGPGPAFVSARDEAEVGEAVQSGEFLAVKDRSRVVVAGSCGTGEYEWDRACGELAPEPMAARTGEERDDVAPATAELREDLEEDIGSLDELGREFARRDARTFGVTVEVRDDVRVAPTRAQLLAALRDHRALGARGLKHRCINGVRDERGVRPHCSQFVQRTA